MLKRVYPMLLTLFGFFGLMLQLLEHIEQFIKLASWSSIFIDNWHGWTQAVWRGVSAVIRLHVPEVVQSILNSALFILAIAAGIRLNAWSKGDFERFQMELNPAAYQGARIKELVDATGDKLWTGSVKSRRATQRKLDKTLKALDADLAAADARNDSARKNEGSLWRSPLILLFWLICGASLYKHGFDFAAPNADLALLAAMVVGNLSIIGAVYIAPIGRLHEVAWLVLLGVVLVVALSYAMKMFAHAA